MTDPCVTVTHAAVGSLTQLCVSPGLKLMLFFFLITIPHLPTLVLAPLAGLESSDLSSKVVSPESLSRLSALVDEEEEDEELPSILSHQGEPSVYLL